MTTKTIHTLKPVLNKNNIKKLQSEHQRAYIYTQRKTLNLASIFLLNPLSQFIIHV
eukprot:GAHX01001461.1.p1 GENE.GAHX01001461.1~~GAHX01001461.1.p1  ORF type:complete len:56 (+),score=6.81 GAHX01001461.1:102-269(+)